MNGAIFLVDPRSFRVQAANAEAAALVGQTPESIPGTPCAEIFPNFSPEYFSAHAHASSSEEQIDTILQRRDGTHLPICIVVESLLCVQSALLWIIRIPAEIPTTISEHRFATFLLRAPDAIMVFDKEGNIVWINRRAEELFGYASKELLRQAVECLIPERYRAAHVMQRNAYSAQPRTRPMGMEIELYGLTQDGREFPVEISLSPLLDEGHLQIMAVIRDVSARKRVQEELARSNAELEQFAYVVSHDLQEPLRMVASYVQLLARRYQHKLGTDADEFIHFAVDGAHRMQALINDLLTYSRLGRKARTPQPVDMDTVLKLALENLKIALDESGAAVTADPLPTVMGDQTQLVELLQNLISNAIKFKREDTPRIHISAQWEDKMWRFSVQDNGIGIAPEYFERIFLIFQRLHTRQEYPGTGVGLAVCKKIVEAHNGNISLESQSGLGTTFHFTLPVV